MPLAFTLVVSLTVGASPTGSSAAFARLAEQFIHESLALSPVTASQAGYHQHRDPRTGKMVALDALLDDVGPSGLARQRTFLVGWRDRLEKQVPRASLGLQDSVDRRLIDDQIAASLLDLDRIQSFQHNPTVYVEMLGSALFAPLSNDYAPKDVRLSHILSRISEVPRFLKQARESLTDADPIYVKVAIEENEGNIQLIEGTIGKEIPAGSPLRARFDQVVPAAVTACREFSTFLKEDLGKRPATRSWRLGKALYAEKFKLTVQSPVTPDQVLANAEEQFARTRAEMLTLAVPLHREMFPAHGAQADAGAEPPDTVLREVLQRISDDHPRRDQLLETVSAELDRIRAFIREKQIVTLGSRDNLKVIPTPPYMRGIYSVAGFHSPPPLDPKAEAQYWVTPIDPSVPEARAESKLREYNRWVLQWLTIHEALPGHYVQAEHANDVQPLTRRLVRTLFGNGPYVEGWAEYVAQVMMDQGFDGGDPRYRLSYLKVWLRAIANAILDIRLQTMEMTEAQAMDLMIGQAFQTEAEAEGKFQRAKLSSAQLPTYFVGNREWWRVRKRYQAARGKDFRLAEFHDRALDQGAIPLGDLERILLPEAAPSSR